jgi:poly-gamma-glutamate capsule biosynthesis protein CapA/YwtB (metallophosphatase superfamily)
VALVVVLVTGAGAAALTHALPWQTTPAPTQDTQAARPQAASEPAETPTPTTPADAVFTLVAAGDVLTHQPVINAASTGGGYDFTPLLAPIQPWVEGADLALCHLEVPVAPAGTSPSGYPMFGAPAQITQALAANGWDGCSTASNHSMDRGVAGVTATLDALDAAGLGHVGTARTAAEAAEPQLYSLYRNRQFIRVAHIAATYGTNGIPVPGDTPFAVSLIDTAALIQQATAAREAGADVVVASIHCCVEYVSSPTDLQQQIATELGASGVIDLVIGHHAHVPQPIARVPGGPRGDGMWVAYGLGNFISNQGPHAGLSAETENGLLLTATFTKPYEGPVSVTAVEWSSLTVDRSGGYRVYPMSASVASGSGAGEISAADLAGRQGRVTAVVGGEAPERPNPTEPTGTARTVPLLRGAA